MWHHGRVQDRPEAHLGRTIDSGLGCATRTIMQLSCSCRVSQRPKRRGHGRAPPLLTAPTAAVRRQRRITLAKTPAAAPQRQAEEGGKFKEKKASSE